MLEVPDERVDGHPDAGKHGRATEDVRIPIESLFAFLGSSYELSCACADAIWPSAALTL
jgi:hypothetical protein